MSARAFAIVMGALALIALLAFGLVAKGDGGVTVGEPPAEGELPFLDPDHLGHGEPRGLRGRVGARERLGLVV